METISLVVPRTGGRSRFSKALPEPPPGVPRDIPPQVVRPVRKDSLPSSSSLSSSSRPALPPKDTNTLATITASPLQSPTRVPVPSPSASSMATRGINSPFPSLPLKSSLSRMNSPPTIMPKRKPVGGGAMSGGAPSGDQVTTSPPVLGAPPPQDSGEVSPVDSICSLLSAYGTEDSSATRYSVDTAATKHSFSEPSPPKLPPKDSSTLVPAVAGLVKLDIVSPLALPTPVSSRMDTTSASSSAQVQAQSDPAPPPPPMKDFPRPTTPKSSSKTVTSPSSPITSQSPSQPQLWRRRSSKSDKPLTVPELKLAVSHGSTTSSQLVANTMHNASHNTSTGPDSTTLHYMNKSLPQNPDEANYSIGMGNQKSKDDHDGFSQYAQEVEDRLVEGTYTNNPAAQYSPAHMPVSPESRRPPTPEYEKKDGADQEESAYTSLAPMTPPEDPRPLSAIEEEDDRTKAPVPIIAAPAAASPARMMGLPRSPRPSRSSSQLGGNEGTDSLAAGPTLAASPAIQAQQGLSPSSSGLSLVSNQIQSHLRSTSVPSIEIHDDASTIKAPSSPTHQRSSSGQPQEVPKPGDPAFFPIRHHHQLPAIAPGTVLPAPALKPSQLACFGGHYRLLPSKNDEHPLACASCHVQDNGSRFTCAHCAVRICGECKSVLEMNGRDLGKLVDMLRG